mgnify:CR=1 FL=1
MSPILSLIQDGYLFVIPPKIRYNYPLVNAWTETREACVRNSYKGALCLNSFADSLFYL